MKTHIKMQRGFTLIEALVALMVVAFGMLAIAGMQLTLARNGEVARQRSEATRLAEEKMEELRSFNSIETGTGLIAWDSIAGSSDTVTVGNTDYARVWTVGGTTADPKREVNVSVSWTDRSGGTTGNSVALDSVIAKIDPALEGALGFPLVGNGTIKRPKNRNLNIPILATDIGDGKSVIKVGTWSAVFDNNSGWVIKYCSGDVTTQAQLDACGEVNAYILAGYVSEASSGNGNGNGNNSSASALDAITAVNLSGLTGTTSKAGGTTPDCSFGAAIDQNNQNTTIDGYKYYICVILVSGENATYGGSFKLAGSALNSGSTSYKVCRVQYTSTTVNANQRNTQPYSNVNESLDQQNYVVTTSSTCPSGTTIVTYPVHQTCPPSGNDSVVLNAVTGTCPAVADY